MPVNQMLPIIELCLADYCRIAFNYCLGLAMPIGHSLWFDRESIVQSGRAVGLNMDEYLTGLLAALFFEKKATSKILTCFAAIPDRFALSLCSSQSMAFLSAPKTMENLPGFLELRHDFIPQTAAPFLLYEGRSVYRLHPVSQPERTAFYVWDFCDHQGNFLKEVDKAFYFRVLNDKNTYYDYAAVPKNPCTSITYQGEIITVHHKFCQVM
ncbi:MAG: hypothetical protein WAU47_00835 [Desulfobaccales bacterium]